MYLQYNVHFILQSKYDSLGYIDSLFMVIHIIYFFFNILEKCRMSLAWFSIILDPAAYLCPSVPALCMKNIIKNILDISNELVTLFLMLQALCGSVQVLTH